MQRVHPSASDRGESGVREAVQEAHPARSRSVRARQPRLRRVQRRLRRGHEADARGDRQAQEAAQSARKARHSGGGAPPSAEPAVCRGAQAAAGRR